MRALRAIDAHQIEVLLNPAKIRMITPSPHQENKVEIVMENGNVYYLDVSLGDAEDAFNYALK